MVFFFKFKMVQGLLIYVLYFAFEFCTYAIFIIPEGENRAIKIYPIHVSTEFCLQPVVQI